MFIKIQTVDYCSHNSPTCESKVIWFSVVHMLRFTHLKISSEQDPISPTCYHAPKYFHQIVT